MIISIIILSVLLLLSGIFSSLETAFTSLTPYDVEDMYHHGGRRGKIVHRLSARPEVLLTTLLIGNNLVNIGASALATSMTIELLGSKFIGSMTGLLTLTVLIFCEVTPKQIALSANRKLALRLASVVLLLTWIFRPFIWVITGVSNFLTSLFTSGDRTKFTLNNLLQMVKMGQNMGIVEDYENQMVKNVFRINDTPVQAIMTHRTETFCLNRDLESDQVYQDIIERGVSRVPLYNGNTENISGILLVKDYLKKCSANEDPFKLKELEETPLFIPRNCKVNELFSLFKKENLNIAVVLDEYGGLDGVVTIHDVVQEIFGSLDDDGELKEPDKISKRTDGWKIMGDADFYDLQDELGLKLDHDRGILTISGFLIEKMGHIPETGEEITLPEGRFIVIEAENNRIVSLLYKKA